MVRRSFLFLGLVLVACGSNEPAPAAPSPTAPASASPAASASEAPAASAEPAAEPKKRRPYEIHSACTDVATIVFGEDPKGAGKRTIAPNSEIEGVRDANGNQTIWLLDTNGEPLVKVNVMRGMKRVEIGRSCRTLDAR